MLGGGSIAWAKRFVKPVDRSRESLLATSKMKRNHSRRHGKAVMRQAYTATEKSSIAEFERRRADPKPPKLRQVKGGEDHEVEISDDKSLFRASLMEATGTTNFGLGTLLVNQVAWCLEPFGLSAKTCNAALAALHGIRPRDELEGMLAVQMVATHNLAMEFTRRAVSENQTIDEARHNVHCIAKLMRTFVAQLEALQHYRGKESQQKVTVEHVHVNQGGQAIVGAVGPEGGGGNGNS